MSNEILAKTINMWTQDFNECLRKKLDNLNQILAMFGLEPQDGELVDEMKKPERENRTAAPSLADVYRAAAFLEKEKCCQAVRNLMRKYGVEDLKYLDASLYAGFINDAEELANEPC